MKSIGRALLCVGIIASLCVGLAYTGAAISAADLQSLIEAAESTTPFAAGDAPSFGNFYSAQFGATRPPLPFDTMNLPFWSLGGGVYIYDDRSVDYAALQAEAQAEAALSAGVNSRFSMAASSLLNTTYAYGNPVYLTNLVATNNGSAITAIFSVAGGTNFVPYDILMTTNAGNSISNWNWLGISYTSNSYTFSNQPLAQAFYILAKPQKTMVVGWGADGGGQCDVPFGLTNALMVTGGAAHSVALLNNGTVMAWGDNQYNLTTVPTNVVAATMVAAGWYHSVALLTNGTVAGWGMHTPFDAADVPANLTNAILISAMAYHSLALTSNGTVVAWGYGTHGETNVPSGLSGVAAIAAGYWFNVVAKTNGAVTAWGDNTYGQTNIPAGLANVVDVEAGPFHSLALLSNGTVVAWGRNDDGETNVPVGLTNVVAIAAGGGPVTNFSVYSAYSLALKSDGTVVSWGRSEVLTQVQGLSNVFSIGAGANHALAIRTGPRTPVITLEPTDQFQLPGGNVTFTAKGSGLYGVTYLWQFNGTNITGATNTAFTVTNVQSGQLGDYDVVVTDTGGMGSLVSSNASLAFVSAPAIDSASLPTNQVVVYQSGLTLSVEATAPGQTNGFPLYYQWQFDGTNISGATNDTFTTNPVLPGTYSVTITNAAVSTNVVWQVSVLYPGNVWAWGEDGDDQSDAPALTNVSAVAAGFWHSVAVLDDGTVRAWGANDVGQTNLPANLTNVIAVAAGDAHSLALKSDGMVLAWGWNHVGQTNVPAGLSNVVAVAAGGEMSMALLSNGTITNWGDISGITNPGDLTNATAIAVGGDFFLALRSNGMVTAWGSDAFEQIDVPSGLSNVVAIAAGGEHCLALTSDGKVTAWGDNSYGQTDVPASCLSNVMSIAAGDAHSMALKNDGTMVAWGDNTYGQTNSTTLTQVKLIAAGGNHSLAAIFSTFVQYPVDVTKDVLLIYNTSSIDSTALKNYYLAHRPLIGNANVLGVSCDTNEITTSNNCDSQIVSPVLTWLTNNPTKHPQYLVLFFDMPTRILNYDFVNYPSVTFRLYNTYPGIRPFITYINGGTLTDCEAYVDKLANIGTNYSPGKLIISASAGGYGNTNYYFDNTGSIGISPNVSGLNASNSVVQAGASPLSITYTNVFDSGLSSHITDGSNITGYICSGIHSSLTGGYATNGYVRWSGNSGWWIIETVESFNGQRNTDHGNFIKWLSSSAFGGTGYSNTPIGAVCHVEEPDVFGVNDASIYFGLWTVGKNFASCAWNSTNTTYFQAVGDPLVTK